jgi:molybdenum-dependent DNA-binding transcriptional regulator ModE
MVQILPKTSLGETLGSALGTGLGAGISGLAQNKLAEMERQKGIQRTQGGLQALGLPKEIAGLPENLQGIVAKQILQQPGQQSHAAALSYLLGNQGAEGQQQPNLQGLNERQASELAKLGLQKQKAAAQEKQFETKEQRIKQHHIDKETLPVYKEIAGAAKGARSTNPILARMQTLLSEGNLPNAAFYNLANKWGSYLGLNASSLAGADAQEFDKLSVEFLKNAKDIFGSRLTNYDVQTFLKSIPSLSQTDEGKQRIINNLTNINKAASIRDEAMERIIENNGGERPRNLATLIEREVGPQLDQIAESFAQGTPLGKPIRQAEDAIANNIAKVEERGLSDQQDGPSVLGEAARHIGRTGARAAESILGIPGDIASTGLGAVNLLTGGRIPGAEQVQNYLPSSENLRKITQALTGETLEPQSTGERISDELVSDFAAFALPVKGKIPFKSAAAKSILGNAAGFLGEKIGGPIGKGLAKIGTVLGISFAGGRKALNNAMQESYKAAEDLAGTAKESAKELGKDIKALTKDVNTGIKTPGKTFVSDSIKGISSAIKNDKIDVKDAWKFKKEVNELLGDKETPATARKYLGRLNESLNKVINSYGKTNTEFGKAFHQAEDIYKGLNGASEIAKNIQNSVTPETLTNNLIKSLLLGAAFKTPGALPTIASGAGLVTGIQKLTRFSQLLKNSAEARTYYSNILRAASKENAAAISRNAKKLDKLATKEGY